MNIRIPQFSLIVMVGPTCSGKSTFAARHFLPTEIVSSDRCREMVADDPEDQSASPRAFDLLRTIVRKRLEGLRITVVDATNLQPRHRAELLEIAQENDCPAHAIVMNTRLQACLDRAQRREGRTTPPSEIRHQHRRLRQSIRGTRREGFRQTHVVDDATDPDLVTIDRTRVRPDLRSRTGPFDIIGDIHGCHQELMELLERLGYTDGEGIPRHPEGRTAIFLGDLVDRGPASDQVLSTVMLMTQAGNALCLTGNHENKLIRHLRGRDVRISHGLAQTIQQLDTQPPEFRQEILRFLESLTEHYVLDNGNLAVSHAGVLEEYQGRTSRRIRDFCHYGKTTGETDSLGLPVREEWALNYHGHATVVYGHTTVDQPRWTSNTINIDTGCVFGGSLTALRYPERELVSVPAHRTHYEPAPRDPQDPEASPPESTRAAENHAAPPAPGQPETGPAPALALDIGDVSGDQQVHTRTRGPIQTNARQNAAALETMSRFALDPRWLVYLPPTISPSDTSADAGVLEHPREALRQYRQDGVPRVILEEKHMGSRAILILGRDPEALARKFNTVPDGPGACYTRTGRRFFVNPDMERQVLDRASQAANRAGLWDRLETDWVILDTEIMPWSLKAQRLIRHVYAPTAGAAVANLEHARDLLARARDRGVDADQLLDRTNTRLDAALRYRQAYRHYCWDAQRVDDIRIAPFHLLAAQGRTLTDQPHTWHLEEALRLHQADPGLFQETRCLTVDLDDPAQEEEAIAWWRGLTQNGGEGAVVKPIDFIPQGNHSNIQPAVKVRGPEYLRIIYGPEVRPHRQHRAAPPPLPTDQAERRPPGVRAGTGGPPALRRRRTPHPGAPVRLRRPGPGVRARRPPAVDRPDRQGDAGPR